MRVLDLGHWLLTAWVVPTLGLGLIALWLAVWALRSIAHDALSARARARRFRLIGWANLFAALLFTAAWPALTSFTRLAVRDDGRWELRNCLGLPLSTVAPGRVRGVEGEDLAGLAVGSGRLRVHLDGGHTLDSVRISGAAFSRVVSVLGYDPARRHELRGSVLVEQHTYGADGPQFILARQ